MKQVAILIVLYNNEQNLISLFNSIGKQKYKDISIYILDNNSSDNSVKLTKNLWPTATIIQHDSNVGFATGNNILARKASDDGAEYLFILNPDMELHPNCVEELVKLVESNIDIGVVAPIVFYSTEDYSKNKIQLYGCKVNFKTQKTELMASGKIFEDIELPEKLEVDYVSGGTTFLKREVFQKIGLFEEKYFLYNDEIDFAFRVQQSGFKTYVTKNAKIWHHHDWSKRNKKRHFLMYYYMLRNRYLYFRKFRLYKYLVIDLVKEILLLPVAVRWAHRFADAKLIRFYYHGIWDGLLNKSGKSNIEFK